MSRDASADGLRHAECDRPGRLESVSACVGRRPFLARGVSTLGCLAISPWSLGQVQSNVARYQLRFSVALTNPGPQVLERQILWMYMPIGETATQKLIDLTVSMPYERSTDVLGHTVVKLEFPRFVPWGSKVVGFVSDVELTPSPTTVAVAEVEPWLRAERYIEADAPVVRALAAELKRSTRLATAQAIYEWVRQNLQYAGYVADDLGALEALSQRRGDCTEYACLAVALARANGIPARVVGGYVVERNAAPRAEDYHNWAEVYVDGSWRLLDAQKGQWLMNSGQYVAFRIYRGDKINPIGMANRYLMDGDLQVRC